MKSTPILFILLLSCFQSFATIYTFHTAGDYTDVSNWDVYPGENLFTNDTISIEANCTNIILSAYDGYIVFSDDSIEIGISDLTIDDDCQLEFQAAYFQLQINGYFFYYSDAQIITANSSYIDLFNSGYGISNFSCQIFDLNTNIYYFNFGTQDAYFLECMEGQFANNGTINVVGGLFFINCVLELGQGTIEGIDPYDILITNGSISQNCPACSATINNVNNIYLNQNTNILGTVILNGPE